MKRGKGELNVRENWADTPRHKTCGRWTKDYRLYLFKTIYCFYTCCRQYKVNYATIADAYTRRLGINTDGFDSYLTTLFRNEDGAIFDLLDKFAVNDKDKADILELRTSFLGGKMPLIKLSPSILAADFGRLGEQVKEATDAGADYIHIDIMDGHFVPNISFGPIVTAAVRKYTSLPLDIHLMIESPEHQIKNFAQVRSDKADIITVHMETCPNIHRVVQQIKELGMKAGVALNPGTPLSTLEEILPYLDLVLVMTVNPGASGQSFIQGMLSKIERLRQELDRKNLMAELEVDGGINAENALKVVNAGARVLVAGSAIFHPGETVATAVAKLKTSYEGTV